jgi:hypothetical protein
MSKVFKNTLLIFTIACVSGVVCHVHASYEPGRPAAAAAGIADEGVSPFKFYNDLDHDVWVRIKILAPGSFRANRHDQVIETQVQRVMPHSESDYFHRRRYNYDLSISVWTDKELTSVLARTWRSTNAFAGLKRINLFETPDEYLLVGEHDFTGMECPLCFEVKNDQDIVVFDCGHKVHFDCIREYLEFHEDCPICRQKSSASRLYKNHSTITMWRKTKGV